MPLLFDGRIEISGNTTFEVQGRCNFTTATFGFGFYGTGWSSYDVYVDVRIWRLSL
jgi:hypothetical protein